MFTLRTVRKSDNAEDNFSLGDSYRFIHREWSPELFAKEMEKRCDIKLEDKEDYNLYAIVICGFGGERMFPILKNEWNYIMSENGKTYANISYKATTIEPE